VDYLAPTTPAKEAANADHRIRFLEGALWGESTETRTGVNSAELDRLRRARELWLDERERNRTVWIDHHKRLYRIHLRLTRDHFRALRRLKRGETPSTNGNGKHDQEVTA
jgi:hypothetical protein